MDFPSLPSLLRLRPTATASALSLLIFVGACGGSSKEPTDASSAEAKDEDTGQTSEEEKLSPSEENRRRDGDFGGMW